MFRIFPRAFCTNSGVKLYQCSKSISAAIAHRVQEEQRGECILPKIFRAQTPIALSHQKFGDFGEECSSLWRSTGNVAFVEDIDAQILQPYGVPAVFESPNKRSRLFEDRNLYGFGASVFIEPYVNLRQGNTYFQLKNESELPDGLILVKDREDTTDCHRIITNSTEMTVKEFREKLNEIGKSDDDWKKQLSVQRISNKSLQLAREEFKQLEDQINVHASVLQIRDSDRPDIISTFDDSEPIKIDYDIGMTLRLSKDPSLFTITATLIQHGKVNPQWFFEFIDMNDHYFDAKLFSKKFAEISAMNHSSQLGDGNQIKRMSTIARRYCESVDDYCLIWMVGSALLSKMEQLHKDGIYQLIVQMPADTPKEIEETFENMNWHSKIDAIRNKKWLTYALSFLCLEDGLIEMEGFLSCNDKRYLERMEKYNRLFDKFEKKATRKAAEKTEVNDVKVFAVSDIIKSKNGYISIRNVLDDIDRDARLPEAAKEEMRCSIESAMYLNSYQKTIDSMCEDDDAVDVEFDINEQEIELLNESLVKGFERYSLRLMDASTSAITKYNVERDSDCIALMTALRGQMDMHLQNLGFTPEF